jgi:hypothetical protein
VRRQGNSVGQDQAWPVLSMLLSGPAAAEFRQIDLTIYGMD